MNFEKLELIAPLLDAVAAQGYQTPTPIQAAAIPAVLAGRDVLACAQTGTGKTAAFVLPILQRLAAPKANATDAHRRGKRAIRVLVLTPTRELATQIAESFDANEAGLGFRRTVIFGGVSQYAQSQALMRGIDIVVATPGRLMDLMGQGLVRLDQVETFVLDEADRMLDMGFIHPIRKIAATLPKRRQTLMFSATLPDAIRQLAEGILTHPEHIAVTPPATTVAGVEQSVYLVEKPNKIDLLLHLLNGDDVTRALVFTKTKHGADKVVRHLSRYAVSAGAIHGNKSQGQRERALSDFRSGAARVLVATDVAARGLHIDDVSHVVNFDLPVDAESYVHRIGRTGRAGATGVALSFCGSDERSALRSIERLIRVTLPKEQTPSTFSMPALAPEPRRDDAPLHFSSRPQTPSARSSQNGEAAVSSRPRRSDRGRRRFDSNNRSGQRRYSS